MGYGVKLTNGQRDELDHLRFRTPSADVYRNCLILLFSDSHDTISTIARRLGCGTDTVKRVRRSYRGSVHSCGNSWGASVNSITPREPSALCRLPVAGSFRISAPSSIAANSVASAAAPHRPDTRRSWSS